ncbi:hypothetical protein [Paraburkholderia phytofirmans]|uniref:Uncharacterized protein n=1 Tax=Paraburkholderia phytofirmans TaxID=261302 RepID=A0ABW9BJR0_9BURK
MTDFVLTMLNSVMSDGLSAEKFAAASSASALAAETLKGVMKRRHATAVRILLEELKAGKTTPSDSDVPEVIAALFRFQRAAEEGAARLNLRLMGAVFAGQVVHRSMTADEFLYLADILAPLKREEVILLGTFARLCEDGGPALEPRDLQLGAIQELVPDVFDNVDAFMATAGALLRTGFVMASVPPTNYAAQMSGFIYRPTHLLSRLSGLLDIEGVVKRHEADQS